MNELVNAIEKMLNDHELWVEEIWSDDETENMPMIIRYEIDGDWKHDHLYSEYLIENYLKEKGYFATRGGEDVTFEDGSDWYKAIHTILIIKVGG